MKFQTLLRCLLVPLSIVINAGCMGQRGTQRYLQPLVNGQAMTQLTYHPANDFSAVWNAQGDQIAFVSDRTGFWNIWVMKRDGSDQRPLTLDRGQATSPTFSPNSTALAFSSDRASPTRQWPDLWIVDPMSGHFEQITATPSTKEFMPSWTPDGKLIAYLSLDMTVPPNWHILLMDVDSKLTHEITSNRILFSRLTWSPDGKEIAFISDSSGKPELWIMDRDGKQARPVTHDGAEKEHPDWSPDGKWIAFASRRSGNWDLWVVHPDGTSLRKLTTSPATDTLPDWNPDSHSLAFTSDRKGNQDIWVVNVTTQLS